jgi:plasmid stabilization system protein ParE
LIVDHIEPDCILALRILHDAMDIPAALAPEEEPR